MHFSILLAFLLTQVAFSVPVDVAPGTDLIIRAWNTTSRDCNWDSPHLYGVMGPNQDVWGDGGNYTTYSLSRTLLANESLELYAFNGTDRCGTYLWNDVLVKDNGCYYDSAGFSCMKMGSI